VVFAFFILWEIYSTVNHKVLPPVLFTYVRGFDLFCVNMFVTGSFVYAINSYWPVFAQNVYARPGNYTDIGILGIQQGAGVMTGCLILCFLTRRIKHLRIQLIIAISWQVIWVGCLTTLTPTSKGAGEAFVYLGGIGVSWTIGVCLTSISLAIPHKWIGAATGAANCFRLLGGTIGLAVYSAILSSKIQGELAAQIIPAANSAGLPASSDKAAVAAAQVFSATAFANVAGANSTIISAIRYAKAEAYINVYK
jgi:Fungal trichothecene efflux pump (TRI12)